jgi:hypothetical protein
MPAGVSAYVALANVTLGSSVSVVTMSSISQSYRDLVLVINGKVVSGSDLGIFITLNSDFGNNYNDVYMEGIDGTTISSRVSNAGASTVGILNSNDANYILNFIDYSATDKHKTFLSRNNNESRSVRAMAHRWANTSAISSIRIAASSSTWVSGTTIALYGVSA